MYMKRDMNIPMYGRQNKGKALVIGGGGIACDVAQAVHRLGVPEVSIVCLESREIMIIHPQDVEETGEEGAEILPHHSLKQILSNRDGWFTELNMLL